MKAALARAAGFTLIEVLVALTLLAVSAGLLLAVQGGDMRLAKSTLDQELAYWLARSRLVEALAFPDQALPEDASNEVYEGMPFGTRVEYREIQGVETATPLPPAHRLTEIRVIVSWGEKAEQKVQLSGYRPLAVAPDAQAGKGADADMAGKPDPSDKAAKPAK